MTSVAIRPEKLRDNIVQALGDMVRRDLVQVREMVKTVRLAGD